MTNYRFCFLLAAVFAFSAASYLISPLIPIYFVESIENNGLGWSRAETFSLFGTFLGLVYVSPFLGGLLGDFFCRRPMISLLGYALFVLGLVLLAMVRSYALVFVALLALGLGIGFVKVSLATIVGRLPQAVRQKGYEYHYITSCLGFIGGALLSNILFNVFAIKGVITLSFLCLMASLSMFIFCFGKEIFSVSSEKPSPVPGEKFAVAIGPWPFALLLILGVPFFICYNQLMTGLSVFLHQCVDRRVGPWTVPALWFGVGGSLTMILFSPWLRRLWKGIGLTPTLAPLKISIGFFLTTFAFVCASLFATYGENAVAPGVPLFMCLYAICHIADFHVRPVLMSAATSLPSPRYQTVCTALVYGCIGLGGKLAGTLAAYADQIGFSGVFAACAVLSAVSGLGGFLWYRRRKTLLDLLQRSLS